MNLHDWFPRNATSLGASASAVALLTLPLIVAGGVVTCNQLRDAVAKHQVGLGFYRVQAPQFRVINVGSTVIRDPKYQLDINDLDVRRR